MSVGTSTDFSKWYKTELAKQAGVAKYEDIFKNMFNVGKESVDKTFTTLENQTSVAYNKQEQAYEAQAHKDISSAYANHLRQAMALKHAENLAGGSKDALLKSSRFSTEQAARAYNEQLDYNKAELAMNRAEAFNKLGTQYGEGLTNLQTNVNATQTAYDKAASDFGNRAANLSKSLLKEMYNTFGNDYEDLFITDNKGNLKGMSEKLEALMYNTNGTLTDFGKKWYGKALYDFDKKAAFEMSTDEYNAYERDKYQLNEMFTGSALNPHDFGLTNDAIAEDVRKYDVATEFKDDVEDYVGYKDLESIRDLFEIDWNGHDSETLGSNYILNDLRKDNPDDFDADTYDSGRDVAYSTKLYIKTDSDLYKKYRAAIDGLEVVKQSGKLKPGDIVKLQELDYLAVWIGNDFRLAKDTPELRKKLGM